MTDAETGYRAGQIAMRERAAKRFDCDCPANIPPGTCPASQGSMRCRRLDANAIRQLKLEGS